MCIDFNAIKEKRKNIESIFAIFYDKQPQVRLKAFELEKKLNNHFSTPLQIIGIPDTIDPIVPRIIGTTPHGHGSLQISQYSAVFKVTYTDDYQTNFDKCKEYLNEKGHFILNELTTTLGLNIKYVGLATLFFYTISEITDEKICKYLNNNFFKEQTTSGILDLEFKKAFLVDDKYYLNYKISNYKKFENKIEFERPKDVEDRGISALIDVNNKYTYLNDKEEKFNIKNFDDIMEILYKSTAKINDIIDKGLFNGGK